MINVADYKIKQKIIHLFDDDLQKEPDLKYFYAIKSDLYKPIIKTWDETTLYLKLSVGEELAKAIKWFNTNSKARERQFNLIHLFENTPSFIVLLSCVDKQNDAQIRNKFCSLSKYIYNECDFSKLVTPTIRKQKQLFTIKYKEVDPEQLV